jgi:hypothetical protein
MRGWISIFVLFYCPLIKRQMSFNFLDIGTFLRPCRRPDSALGLMFISAERTVR